MPDHEDKCGVVAGTRELGHQHVITLVQDIPPEPRWLPRWRR